MGVGGIATVGSIYSKLVLSNRNAARLRDLLTSEVRLEWARSTESIRGGGDPLTPPIGSTLGFLYIPRLRNHVWGFPIVEGTDPSQLNVGIGHLTQTTLPGQVGNVALFGHRTSSGKPFEKFDELSQGDAVIIETKDAWLTYSMVMSATVLPNATWVAKPNPFKNVILSAALPTWKTPPSKVLSLITCTPRYSTKFRLVWWAMQTARADHLNPPSAITSA